MSGVIRVRCDAKVLVPDEPLQLPANRPVEVEVRRLNFEGEPDA